MLVPDGTVGCSHGWSVPAVHPPDAEPVEEGVFNRPPRRGGGIFRQRDGPVENGSRAAPDPRGRAARGCPSADSCDPVGPPGRHEINRPHPRVARRSAVRPAAPPVATTRVPSGDKAHAAAQSPTRAKGLLQRAGGNAKHETRNAKRGRGNAKCGMRSAKRGRGNAKCGRRNAKWTGRNAKRARGNRVGGARGGGG